MELPTGHYLQKGKYQLTETVGRGGFGITYKGVWFTEVKGSLGKVKTEVPICIKEYFFKDYCYRDEETFAVKVHSETGRALFEKFKEKLIKEAKILSDVHHPHIVNVLEVFEENDTAYIAMEYIQGYSLKYLLEKEGRLSENTVLFYTHQIAHALQFVHEKSILHLDIKPSNILIDKDDNARLIDFGVSKRYDLFQQETSTTMLTLSKGFASVEQYDDEGTQNFSPCPDIYSLGATMYNLLTGKIPTESILRAAKPLQKPSELNPSISERTEEAIMKAMAIVQADRFQSVNEMILALGPSPEREVREKTNGVNGTSQADDATELYTLTRRVDLEEPTHENTKTILQGNEEPVSNPDDDTILERGNVDELEGGPVKRRNYFKPILISLIIFVCVGTVLYFINLKSRNSDNIPEPIDDKKPLTVSEDNRKNTDTLVLNNAEEHKNNSSLLTVTPLDQTIKDNITSVNEPDVQPVPAKTPDTDYASLLDLGKKKLAKGDYQGARNDFNKAKELSLTEEILRLLITCDSMEEQSVISNRRSLYEEKMPFGNYIIVRNKSTGKYGAIDSKGIDRIPCVYLSVGKAEKGRAFEREDNLFDIYNSSCELVSKGVTYY